MGKRRQSVGRPLVEGVSFDVEPGEVVALVGESGSGKSTVCRAIFGLLDNNLEVDRGDIHFRGQELTMASEKTLRSLRARHLGMILQDPLSSLNPVRSIGMQLREARRLVRPNGKRLSRAAGRQWVLETLEDLGFPDARRVSRDYPVGLSGGMSQRICIAMAFAGDPDVIIADEPTTSLDVSLQGRILNALLRRVREHSSALVLVTHDMSVVRAVADRVVVLYGGKVLESGPVSILDDHGAGARQPYTGALVRSVPGLDPDLVGRWLPTIVEQRTGEVTGQSGSDVGCPFAPRCPNVLDRCRTEFPPETPGGRDHVFACWNPEDAGESA